jgi:hypothetical protein
MDCRKIGCEDVSWIKLAMTGSMVGSCEHGDKPSGSTNAEDYLNTRITDKYSRKIPYS